MENTTLKRVKYASPKCLDVPHTKNVAKYCNNRIGYLRWQRTRKKCGRIWWQLMEIKTRLLGIIAGKSSTWPVQSCLHMTEAIPGASRTTCLKNRIALDLSIEY